ncbi:hypothetical protein [Iamia sp.]|uniref:hypothetical protein n=1 Tax=Iamia sp. TaxID=2722710 RepID=UPI002D054634|nr:hypothetical protein [Iamia sp.]HXH56558.1 hypothetical protein [Iamia sp.]
MGLADLLDALDDGPVDLDLIAGRLRLTGPPGTRAELGPAIARHRALLIAHLGGRRTGHALAPCTTCNQVSMTAVKRGSWPACRMTPGCTGRHQPRPADLARLATAPRPPAQATPDRRPATKRLAGTWPCYPPIIGDTPMTTPSNNN